MIRIDMDMPDKCSECVFAHHDTFGFSGSCIVMFGESHIIDFGSKKRQGWCPLHPIELVRKINALEKDINEKYGVRMIAGYIPGMIGDATGEVTVRRGIEEIEKALGKEAKIEPYFPNIKSLRVYGVVFQQYADDKTKTFVKAFREPPKVRIVDDDRI